MNNPHKFEKANSIKNMFVKCVRRPSVVGAVNVCREAAGGESTATLLHVRATVPVGEMRPSAPLQVTVPG